MLWKHHSYAKNKKLFPNTSYVYGGGGGVLLCFAQSPTQVYVVFDLPLVT